MDIDVNFDSTFSFVSKEHENFIKELLEVYRENSVLWDKSHPNNKNMIIRYAALENLLTKCQEYFPQADIDFVKHKLDGMRNAFRREYRKVMASKKSKKNTDIYVPNLWYYNLMLFTLGEEDSDSQDMCHEGKHIWSREYIILLIDLFKNHPILYSPKSPENTLFKRNEAYSQITRKLVSETGKFFEVKEVKKKITSLKDQFRRDYKYKKVSPSLWCYELLSFLKNEWIAKRDQLKEDSSDDDTENNLTIGVDIKPRSFPYHRDDNKNLELDEKDTKLFIEENYDDIYDAIGKTVALKLRDMTDGQRKYAENLINEIMYNGLMEKLTNDSKLSLDGF